MIAFAVLGSGSRGNASVVRCGDRCLLVDCGLSPKATRERLATLGLTVGDVTDILVTHFDSDHFYARWGKVAAHEGITIHLHERHRGRALQRDVPGGVMHLFDDAFELDSVWVNPLRLAHDQLGSVGFVIEHDGCRLGWATDLGRVPKALIRHFERLHALAIESNYDPGMQQRSGRPKMLIDRIMSGRGHLSNEQSLDAVRAIAATSALESVVTLHLSEQCNDPRLVRRGYADRAPDLLDALTISNQRVPTSMIEVKATGTMPQLELF